MGHSVDKDLAKTIRDELARWPVSYEFGHGGRMPFVQITTPNGERPKISLPSRPGNHTFVTTQATIRRTLKSIGVQPLQNERRAVRTGTLGLFLEDAAKKVAPPPAVKILPPEEEDHGPEIYQTANAPPEPLCPDAIRARIKQPVASVPAPTSKEETKPMLMKVVDPAPVPNAERTIVKMMHADVVQATRLILANAVVNDQARTVTYSDGWSDERIHEILSKGREGLRVKTVREFRQLQFGATPDEVAAREAATKPVNIPALEAANRNRILALEKSLSDVLRRLGDLEDATTRPGA